LDAEEATVSKGKRGRRSKNVAPEPEHQLKPIYDVSMQVNGTKVIEEASAGGP
jgi:hypothetical protein